MEIELYYEFGSTYSYPAVMLADREAEKRGHIIVHRPFLLGPLFVKQGLDQPPFLKYPVKGAYMFRDLARSCAQLGLGWNKPSSFPRRAVLPTRLAIVGFDEGWGLPFAQRVFTLNFVDDREIDDEPNMRALLAELGVEGAFEKALSAPYKDKLRAQTARAEELGLFGAPTFVVGRELFWGQDRMQQAFDWADRPWL
ncbi:MAG TPA: 2-hydroxychromene-2-carboxylate isomerase [Polyangiales bacterium]|nr:2-hydroxychromene-2-carboxylate isomerase [Polyangiales bacterium]